MALCFMVVEEMVVQECIVESTSVGKVQNYALIISLIRTPPPTPHNWIKCDNEGGFGHTSKWPKVSSFTVIVWTLKEEVIGNIRSCLIIFSVTTKRIIMRWKWFWGDSIRRSLWVDFSIRDETWIVISQDTTSSPTAGNPKGGSFRWLDRITEEAFAQKVLFAFQISVMLINNFMFNESSATRSGGRVYWIKRLLLIPRQVN